MGLVYQHIRLANAALPEIEVDAKALVDSGAIDLGIPAPGAMAMGARPADREAAA